MVDMHFLTTNSAKFSHLKYLLEEYDINLRPPVDYGKPYEEPRIHDRERLLRESVEDALKRQSVSNDRKEGIYTNRIFIIEDTSVKVNALSHGSNEVPGVDVKYWMKGLTFEELNRRLADSGGDRSVEVRSDIVLYLPDKYLGDEKQENIHYFHGISEGSIVQEERALSTNLFYPWLDNKTFNKWFCPENEDIPISCLPISKTIQYDFRKKALDGLISFLLECGVISEKSEKTENILPKQIDIFDRKMVLCGPTCAGKTALASHLARKYGYYHVEASDFMYLEFFQRHGYDSEHSIHDFALAALAEDPNIVSAGIIKFLDGVKKTPVIVTGFRSPNEMEWFFNVGVNYELFFVTASKEIRFSRDQERKRFDANKTFEEFLIRDRKQSEMGLDRFIDDDKFTVINNESSLKSYFSDFEHNFLPREVNALDRRQADLNDKLKTSISLETAILLALFLNKGDSEYYSTAEIASLINKDLSKFRFNKAGDIDTKKDNVSRYFNQHFYPFYEVRKDKGTNKFRLSLTGISHALLKLRMMKGRSTGQSS